MRSVSMMRYDFLNLGVFAVVVSVAKYRTLERQVQMTLCTLTAVIFARRRHRNKKHRCRKQVFLNGVGIFGMTEENITPNQLISELLGGLH